MKIPCPHFDIEIVSRGKGRSVIAAAAYQSGETLFSQYTGTWESGDHEERIVHKEILLPPNAPREYADRQTLWNAVDAAEDSPNAQTARRLIIALPKELTLEQNVALIRQYCQTTFVDKGMIADIAVHFDHKEPPNPHAHILLTMRAMDEHGKWLAKSKSVYAVDEKGDRIIGKNGKPKRIKVDTVDWNNRDNCERWRHESQKRHYRFKIGTIGEKKPDEWLIVEGTHEPIIDRATFEIVQEKLRSRQRVRNNGELSLFAGIVKCGECGKALTHRIAYAQEPKPCYCCKTYNAYGKGHCTQHRILEEDLIRIVLEKIREYAHAAMVDSEDVTARLRQTVEDAERERLVKASEELKENEARLASLTEMITKLYEDRMMGRISEENFSMLMAKTQTEQEEAKARIRLLQQEQQHRSRSAFDDEQWREAIRQYADITELDAVTLNKLVRQVVVHEEIGEDESRRITVEIHFNMRQPILTV